MAGEPIAWDAYVSTVMRIETPGGVVWVRPAPVTQTTGAYPDPEGHAISVITAHNPGGRVASNRANVAAEARLKAELERRGLTWWAAAGGDPSWTHVEPSAAIIGIDEAEALALGAEFGQDAIFMLSPTDCRVIGCAGKRVAATGWSIEPDTANPPESADEYQASEEPAYASNPHGEITAEPHNAAPTLEVMVLTENLQVDDGPVTPKNYQDYIDWVGRCEGLLCTLRCDRDAITLHGNGQGGALIIGEWDGPQEPFPILVALQKLADADVLEDVTEFFSGTWGPADVATLVAPFISYSDFVVDGKEWFSDDGWGYPRSPRDVNGIVLAEASWELDEPMPYSISGESGAELLTRIGPKYVTYSINGAEYEHAHLDAANDEDAVAMFKTTIGVSWMP